MPLVELHKFLIDPVTDSPHLGRARSAHTPSDKLGGNRILKKRSIEGP
jgi:hypothetical protein